MLRKKMIRDIKQNLSQFITIFLMVFIGVMVYSGIESYMEGMKQTANNFYTQNNLQDLNVIGANFTKEDLDNIKKIDHVKNAERKLSITTKTTFTKLTIIPIMKAIVDIDKYELTKLKSISFLFM